jgi:UDP-N-acetylglucosamine:LPS N-acetylglucosamine transferase
VPLAYEWRYQEVNADWLVERNAAIRLDEPDMEAKLVPLIQDLMQDSARMSALKEGLAKIARTDGATNIARTLLEFVK